MFWILGFGFCGFLALTRVYGFRDLLKVFVLRSTNLVHVHAFMLMFLLVSDDFLIVLTCFRVCGCGILSTTQSGMLEPQNRDPERFGGS